MKAGDIVFVRGDTLISKAIKWIDKGEFSHVVIAISDTTVLEAEYSTRVRETEFYYTDYEILDLNLTELERHQIKIIGQKQIGKWYDYPQILFLIFKRFFRYKGKNRLNLPNHYICSELIDHLLDAIGKIPPGTDLSDCTPNQLYHYLSYQFPQTKPAFDPIRKRKKSF